MLKITLTVAAISTLLFVGTCVQAKGHGNPAALAKYRAEKAAATTQAPAPAHAPMPAKYLKAPGK